MTDLTAFAWVMTTLLLVGGLAHTIIEFRRGSDEPLKPARRTPSTRESKL